MRLVRKRWEGMTGIMQAFLLVLAEGRGKLGNSVLLLFYVFPKLLLSL